MNNSTPTAQSGPSDRAIAQAFRELNTMDCLHGDALMLYELAVKLESQHPPAGARDAVTDGEKFADWLAREMPSGTVISNPYWWAPRIIRALAALTGKADDAQPAQPAATGAGESGILPPSNFPRDERELRRAIANMSERHRMELEPFMLALMRIENARVQPLQLPDKTCPCGANPSGCNRGCDQ